MIKTTTFGLTYTFSSLLLVLLIAQQSLAQGNDTFNPNTLCPLLANGTKIKDPRYCNVYIVCMNDTSVSGSCGDQFFDLNTGLCVDPDTIDCISSNPCAKQSTGFAPDPYSCNGYYYCSNGVGTHGECSSGLNYNPDTNNCIRNFPCEITMLPDDYCNIVPVGAFIKVPDSCTQYQTCWQSQLLNGTCPTGFLFDAFRGDCDYPQNVNCVDKNNPEIPVEVSCNQTGVFISDGVTCNGYFYCGEKNDEGDYKMIHGNCPVDRFFVATNGGECLPRTSIRCPYDRCVTLGLDFMQMANIDDDGCIGFAICQYGKEISRAECPQGQYFDEMAQLCVDEEITYAACSTSPSSTTTSSTTGSTIITSSSTISSTTTTTASSQIYTSTTATTEAADSVKVPT
ncbi:peritrophin-44 [Stomoxys calcitrans]|uniref:Chitin-binding type-2 domain-containing protein n=1 Tax=Stomoxys calcitrans TaxID=35570 RepID=A0A1I8QFA7_STOCA|nr:peritrophin-44 [Stomoxys calcitrans]